MLRMDHFAFEVKEMDRAVDFYHRKLGLPLISRGVNEEVGEEFAFLRLDHGTLELLRLTRTQDARSNEIRPSFCPHLAFQTDDMDETLRMAREGGIPIVKGPLEIPGEERWVYMADPDGNVVEFIYWNKKA